MTISGLSFLQPAALWALAAVSIPIIIHLFNRSRGRLVKIGHIDLIRNARKLKVTELKLADWLLLLLRVSLFILAALILAGLALPGLSSSEKDTAYVSRAWLLSATANEISNLLVDYSDNKTKRIYLLQDDFPALDSKLVEELRTGQQQDLNSLTPIRNIWPLLSERLSVEQHRGKVDVFAVDNLAQFGASRAALPQNVGWQLGHYKPTHDSLTSALDIVLAFDSSRRADADILRAAFISLKAYRLPGLSWKLLDIESLSDDHMDTDWLILLSETAVAADFAGSKQFPGTVLTDAFGDSEIKPAQQLQLPFFPFSNFVAIRAGNRGYMPPRSPQTGLDLAADVQTNSLSTSAGAMTLLSTTAGLPILQMGRQGAAKKIHFNSRFNPEWSSLVSKPEFPEILLQLMGSESLQQVSFPDARVIPSQLQQSAVLERTATPLPRRSLQSLLAAIMVLLWLAERWLSERRRDASN